MRTSTAGCLMTLFLLAGATSGHAADKPISGAKLVLSRSSSGAEKLTFVSKDVGFLFPSIGGGDDPSAGGASVTLVSPLEAPVAFAVPAGIGNPGWNVKERATLDSYRFTNGLAPGGPSVVRSAKLREKRGIKIVARGTGLALTAPQGSVAIRITTGTLRNCALFDAATVLHDEPGRFIARGAIAGSGDCSDASLGAPPTTTTTLAPGCGDGIVEADEQCDGTTCNADPSGEVDACFPPGDPNQCQCCSTEGHFCSEGSFSNGPVPCCAGLRCEVQFVIGAQGNGFCTTSPCNSYGSVCGGGDCCDGLVCLPPAPGFPLLVCDTLPTTTTTTTTTLPPVCGNGIIEGSEQCDGAATGACVAPQSGCFPPGDPSQCTCCSHQHCVNGQGCCAGETCIPDGGHLPTGDTGLCTAGCDPNIVCSATGVGCCPEPWFSCSGVCCALTGGSCASNPCCSPTATCVDGVCQ